MRVRVRTLNLSLTLVLNLSLTQVSLCTSYDAGCTHSPGLRRATEYEHTVLAVPRPGGGCEVRQYVCTEPLTPLNPPGARGARLVTAARSVLGAVLGGGTASGTASEAISKAEGADAEGADAGGAGQPRSLATHIAMALPRLHAIQACLVMQACVAMQACIATQGPGVLPGGLQGTDSPPQRASPQRDSAEEVRRGSPQRASPQRGSAKEVRRGSPQRVSPQRDSAEEVRRGSPQRASPQRDSASVRPYTSPTAPSKGLEGMHMLLPGRHADRPVRSPLDLALFGNGRPPPSSGCSHLVSSRKCPRTSSAVAAARSPQGSHDPCHLPLTT